jgi:hypothetical protein
MSRLFITQREIDFINDIGKEVIKDVIGQKIYYYPISDIKSKIHTIYNESLNKVFDNPIEIEALVSDYEQTQKINNFGVDNNYTIELYLHYKDLIDKGIIVSVGDFFSYGNNFFEITQTINLKNVYGLPEHRTGIKIQGTQVRESQFKTKIFGPTDIKYSDADAVQKEFEQQRGFEENSRGEKTGDKRDLIENGKIEKSIGGQRKIKINSSKDSSFYDDE